MRTTTFRIDGMHGDGCSRRIQTLLEGTPGVRAATVSFSEGLGRVRHDPRVVDEERLVVVIEKGGFDVAERQP